MLRDVDAEIADAHAQLAELDQRRAVVTQRLADLNRLQAGGTADGPIASGTELSAASKVELFRDVFRGRQDVFAVRWENRAKGRSGYSPRCGNEWKPGVCHKPKVRCGSCTNQAFASLGDRELLAHLQGRLVVGIYPVLPDDTCRLLAIDLDGASWRADAHAIRETCRSLDLEPTIERSRSGNGALIALPLQREARMLGNTEFLDKELEPHEDQWSVLASVPKIAPDRLAGLMADSAADRVLAVRTTTERPELPWRPSRTLAERLRAIPMPDT